MRFLFSTVAASAVLLACPVGATDPAYDPIANGKRLLENRYTNYLYCQAYSLEGADGLKSAGRDDSAARANAEGFGKEAVYLQNEMKISDDDAAERLEDARLEIYLKAESLDEAGFRKFDEFLFDWCTKVAAGEPELEQELKW